MAANETTAFPPFQLGYLNCKEDDSNTDSPLVTDPFPHLVSNDDDDDPRSGKEGDQATNEDGASHGSPAPPGRPDPGTSGVCKTDREAYREALVEKTWEIRRSESPVATGCRLLVRPARADEPSSKRRMRMDVEEVKACRDLGLALPCDRTYEITPAERPRIPGSFVARRCRISHTGGDPRDVKARLKVWAHAVAVTSASRHSS